MSPGPDVRFRTGAALGACPGSDVNRRGDPAVDDRAAGLNLVRTLHKHPPTPANAASRRAGRPVSVSARARPRTRGAAPGRDHSGPDTAATTSTSTKASGLKRREASKVMLVGTAPVRNSRRTAPYSWSLSMSVRYVRMLMTSARPAPCAVSRAAMASKTPWLCSVRSAPSATCPERQQGAAAREFDAGDLGVVGVGGLGCGRRVVECDLHGAPQVW